MDANDIVSENCYTSTLHTMYWHLSNGSLDYEEAWSSSLAVRPLHNNVYAWTWGSGGYYIAYETYRYNDHVYRSLRPALFIF